MSNGILEVFRNWDPEAEVTVKVKFLQKETEAPVTGDEYTARLYDREIFTDDNYLGHSQLDEKGEAHIHFFPANVKHMGLIWEKFPDLYVLLFKGDVVHFQSKVWENVDFEKLGLLDINEGEVLNFGTFYVD